MEWDWVVLDTIRSLRVALVRPSSWSLPVEFIESMADTWTAPGVTFSTSGYCSASCFLSSTNVLRDAIRSSRAAPLLDFSSAMATASMEWDWVVFFFACPDCFHFSSDFSSWDFPAPLLEDIDSCSRVDGSCCSWWSSIKYFGPSVKSFVFWKACWPLADDAPTWAAPGVLALVATEIAAGFVFLLVKSMLGFVLFVL